VGRVKEPTYIYFDDPASWIHAGSGIGAEEQNKLIELESELLLPLVVKDKLLGFMSLAAKLSEQPYTRSDLRLLSSVASQTGVALEVARLTAAMNEETARRERLKRELEIAREVQQRLFPQNLPTIEGIDYSGLCRPAREVGGDYYDFIALPEGKLGLAIGDVSGKGIGAGLMMAGLSASLRGQTAVTADNLSALTARLSRTIFETSPAHAFVTFFYGVYDPLERQLTYVNAGHNPPILLRHCGSKWEVIRLETGGTPLGLFREAAYQDALVTLGPGDLVVAFTEGVSETMNASKEEWGEAELIETMRGCEGLNADQTIARILTAADSFADDAPQQDDVTLVALLIGDTSH
jgi:sigma-B regulation protein RsbU (phosphoserine phosphatase)